MNEQFRLLVRKWRAEAEQQDDWCRRESRYFSVLEEEEKARWRYDQTAATIMRGCANELERLLSLVEKE